MSGSKEGRGDGAPSFKRSKAVSDYVSFKAFCRNATDAQLEEILAREWEASRFALGDRMWDYMAALFVANERGWAVEDGRRI